MRGFFQILFVIGVASVFASCGADQTPTQKPKQTPTVGPSGSLSDYPGAGVISSPPEAVLETPKDSPIRHRAASTTPVSHP